jgi:hypothetical protein
MRLARSICPALGLRAKLLTLGRQKDGSGGSLTNDDRRVQRLQRAPTSTECGTADQNGSDRCTLISARHKLISLHLTTVPVTVATPLP